MSDSLPPHRLYSGEGNGNPLQCSCLENPKVGGAWWAAVYGVAQSRTRLKRLSSSSRLYSPWNSQGQNTGVGSYSLLQEIFPNQGSNRVSHTAGRFFTSWVIREAQEHWSGQPMPSPADLPNSGIEPGSPALQADSLPAEILGKPIGSLLHAKNKMKWKFY